MEKNITIYLNRSICSISTLNFEILFAIRHHLRV
jgi:hypothetical protein